MKLTDERSHLKTIGYALTPHIKFLKAKDIGKEFGIPYAGGNSKVAKSLNLLVSKKLLEVYSERQRDKLYYIDKDRKGLEELYHEILWKNFK